MLWLLTQVKEIRHSRYNNLIIIIVIIEKEREREKFCIIVLY